MKKLLFAVLITAFTLSNFASTAQTTKITTKTITAADTMVFNAVPSKVKAFYYRYTETSGTTAGKVYLEGSTLSGVWDALDSLTLSDVTTVQKKTVTVTATNYVNYRWRNTNTSSATGTVSGGWLRRSDE